MLMFYLQVSGRVLQHEQFYSWLFEFARSGKTTSLVLLPCRPLHSMLQYKPYWDRGWRKNRRETSPERTAPNSTAESWSLTHVPMLLTTTGGKSISSHCLSSSSEAGEDSEWKGKKGACASSVPSKRINVTFKIRKLILCRNLCKEAINIDIYLIFSLQGNGRQGLYLLMPQVSWQASFPV